MSCKRLGLAMRAISLIAWHSEFKLGNFRSREAEAELKSHGRGFFVKVDENESSFDNLNIFFNLCSLK